MLLDSKPPKKAMAITPIPEAIRTDLRPSPSATRNSGKGATYANNTPRADPPAKAKVKKALSKPPAIAIKA